MNFQILPLPSPSGAAARVERRNWRDERIKAGEEAGKRLEQQRKDLTRNWGG